MHTFVRAPADTTEGWAKAFAYNMNEFGWLRSGPGAIKRLRAYPRNAKAALKAADDHMTPLILGEDVPSSELDLWNARYQDCKQGLDRMQEILATGGLAEDDWHAMLSAIACAEATIVGALATLSAHGITLRATPRLPDKGK